MNKQQLYKQKTVVTTSYTHIYTASQACSEDNLEHKMQVQYISPVEIQCKICKKFTMAPRPIGNAPNNKNL